MLLWRFLIVRISQSTHKVTCRHRFLSKSICEVLGVSSWSFGRLTALRRFWSPHHFRSLTFKVIHMRVSWGLWTSVGPWSLSCSCWSSSVLRYTCTGSKVRIGFDFSTMKRSSNVVFNRLIEVFSKRSRKVWIIFWVFSKVLSPFKLTNNRLRLESFWVGWKSKLVLYITNHVEMLCCLSSYIVVLLVTRLKVRIYPFKSFVLHNIESLIPCWESSSWVFLCSLDSQSFSSSWLRNLWILLWLSCLCWFDVKINWLFINFISLVYFWSSLSLSSSDRVAVFIRCGWSFILRDGVSDGY